MQRRDDLAEEIRRIDDRSAEKTAVQIVARTSDEDFRVAKPTQPVSILRESYANAPP